MKRKKILYIVLGLIAILMVMLSACGGDTNLVATDPANNGEMGEGSENSEGSDAGSEPTDEPVIEETTRVGGWLDTIAMSVVSSDSAVTQIDAGAIDIYAGILSTPQDLESIRAAGLEKSEQFGLFYELTFNPVGPTFEGTGKLNPFSSARIREAMNWLVDREYINEEVYGGGSVPKWFPITSGFPDYARYIDLLRPLESRYSFNEQRAEEVISEEMIALGAEMVDGKWTFEGEPVELIFLIRTDSDGTRVPIGDYVSGQLESIGFTVDRQYKTSSESSPLWILGNPQDGLWHLYTGAWSVSAIARDLGQNFQFYYTQQSAYAFSPLFQAYDFSEEDLAVTEALANNSYSTMEERRELFAEALELIFDYSYRVWLIDGKGFSPWRPGVEVSYDLAGGVDVNTLAPFTLRLSDQEGGLVRWGNADLFVDPANPVAGSNWTFDSQWQNATSDWDAIPNPFTGVQLPQRMERAEVVVEEGLPVTKTYDWVDLSFAPEIAVPEESWVDWDPASEKFITAGEKFPEGLTAKAKIVAYYPDSVFDIQWHDGSPFDVADMVMAFIMTFAPGSEGSPIFDESQAPVLQSFLSAFKGYRIVSESPLVMEWYTDTWYMDAESIVVPFRARFWPEYGYGQAPWHMMAVSNLSEEAGELAYSADKSDALSVEWMSYIAGPSLDLLAARLDEAAAANLIPFEPTMGEFVTAEEAAARYANLQTFYEQYGHFWVGTGPYILQDVRSVEKTATLIHNPNFIDLANKWSGFAVPRLAEVAIDGPGRITIGEEAMFDVFVSFQDEPYPADEVSEVKFLLYDAAGEIVEVGSAELVSDGYYTVTLSAETTALLEDGANKLEVAVVVVPVSIPSLQSMEFVAE
jgi:peptide/nickel transport system substrate-binding protein